MESKIRLGMATVVFFLGILSSPIYIFSSGLPQPSNLIILIAVLLVFFSLNSSKIKIGQGNAVVFLLLFFSYVFFCNSIWALLGSSWDFNIFTVHLAYNIFVFIGFYSFLLRYEKAIGALCWSVVIAFVGMLVIWSLGLGRYDFMPRYNGYFNDPNQMAFWVLCATASYFILSEHGYLIKMSVFTAAVVLVFITMSRSALLGLSVMSVGLLLKMSAKKKLFLWQKLFLLAVSSGVAIYFLMISMHTEVVQETVQRLQNISVEDQLDNRGYGRLIAYPNFLLFGAGQGLDDRFGSRYEIHSTWVAFLFYYGAVGFVLFSIFIFSLMRKLGWHDCLILSGPLAYSFTTFGARSTMFWVLLAVAMFAGSKKISGPNEGCNYSFFKTRKIS